MKVEVDRWYLPKSHKLSNFKDNTTKYIVSELQLRRLFMMKWAPLDFNRDYIMEFIKKEGLKKI